MERNTKDLYEFGPFRLVPQERRLQRGDEAVPLTPKAFDLLLVMVAQQGHLLTKEELLNAVWPDSFVEENNLADNISRLRKALGEGDDGCKFIETVPKRGYRFVGDVRKQSAIDVERAREPMEPAASRAGRRIPAKPAALVLAAILAGSALWFYGWKQNIAEARQLQFKGAFYATMWTEPEIRKGIQYYNRAIALDPSSSEAYVGLATAWIFLADLHVPPREAIQPAKAAVGNALRLNEKSAPAHVSLGVIKMEYDWDWTGAEAEFKRAIQLDASYHPAHQLYGWYLIAVGRSAEAQEEMTRALEGDPLNEFSLWELGLAYYFAGRLEPAVEQYRRAISVEPKSHWAHMLLGWALERQGKFDEAIAEAKIAYRANDTPQVLASLGHTYAVAGRRAEAQAVLGELADLAKSRYVSPYDVATIHAGLGDKDAALAWLEKAYEDRSGWLALWVRVDPKFSILGSEPRFQNLLRRVGHRT